MIYISTNKKEKSAEDWRKELLEYPKHMRSDKVRVNSPDFTQVFEYDMDLGEFILLNEY